MSYVPRLLTAAASVALVACVGCDDAESTRRTPARPVTYLVLSESNPSRLTRLTGSVESWKKEMLSCRVDGRVTSVVEPGVNIEGRRVNDDGSVKDTGTLLASLQDDQYQLLRDESVARVEVAKARVTQAKTELEQAIPERVKEAVAERDRRVAEFERQKKLLEGNATSVSVYEESENWMKQAEASLAQAEISKATKAAELEALEAQVLEAEQVLRQAELDLSDCNLYSPFAGQVSKVHAIAGSFVDEGMPIVTVQMMDPVKVELAVSRETDRRLRYNDQLNVYLENVEEPISGFVYLKDTVADAATRTFNITVLIRNRQVEARLPAEYADSELPRTMDLYNLESEFADGEPPFFTDESTVHTDADGRKFVWKAEGLTAADLKSDFDPAFTVKKAYIELGERTLPILQLYRGIEVTDLGELDPNNDLVTGQLPDGVKDGDKVLLSRNEWMLRPGQLVNVELKGQPISAGFYVPRPAVLLDDGKHYVFLANDTGSGEQTARRVEVKVGELIGDYRRIESAGDTPLKSGSKLILDGAHYLRDGDPVNAFDEVEAAL